MRIFSSTDNNFKSLENIEIPHSL